MANEPNSEKKMKKMSLMFCVFAISLGFHSVIFAETLPNTHINYSNNCKGCHATNNDESIVPTEHLINHDEVLGSCESCHVVSPFYTSIDHNQAYGSCETCHAVYPTLYDSHSVAELSANCRVCHTSTAWLPALLEDLPKPDNWEVSNGQRFVMIPMGGLIIPIQTREPEIVLKNKQFGKFTYAGGRLRSLTRVQVVGPLANPPATSNFRPTLFVSVRGFSIDGNLTAPEAKNAPWQDDLNDQLSLLAQATNPRASQYKHIMIGWDSYKIMARQVEDAAEGVIDFLNDRAYDWDVVVIGHSRGGIFAHELSEKIVSNGNIANLHTILLDPTATIGVLGWMADQYPLGLKSKSGGTHHGSLFYDKQHFGVIADVSTVGDQPIIGYTNYGRGINDHLIEGDIPVVSHIEFGEKWVESDTKGLERALTDIWARKTTDTFNFDPAGSVLELYDIREDDFIIDGNFGIADGNVTFDGMIVGYGAGASINGEIGVSGVDVATTILIVSAQVTINSSYVGASANVYLSNASAALSGSGVNTSMNVLGLNQSASVSFDGGLNAAASSSLLGSSIETEFGTSGVEIRVGGTTVFSAEQVAGTAVDVSNVVVVTSWNVTEGVVIETKNIAVGLISDAATTTGDLVSDAGGLVVEGGVIVVSGASTVISTGIDTISSLNPF